MKQKRSGKERPKLDPVEVACWQCDRLVSVVPARTPKAMCECGQEISIKSFAAAMVQAGKEPASQLYTKLKRVTSRIEKAIMK